MAGFIAFVPMWPGDSEEAAESRLADSRDYRLTYWWDGARASDRPFAATLGLAGSAWDIYLLYSAGTTWTGDAPSVPHFWMHQLPDERDTHLHRFLDPNTFESALEQLLQAAEGHNEECN